MPGITTMSGAWINVRSVVVGAIIEPPLQRDDRHAWMPLMVPGAQDVCHPAREGSQQRVWPGMCGAAMRVPRVPRACARVRHGPALPPGVTRDTRRALARTSPPCAGCVLLTNGVSLLQTNSTCWPYCNGQAL